MDREILHLTCTSGLAPERIAAALALDVDDVRQRKSRALRIVRLFVASRRPSRK